MSFHRPARHDEPTSPLTAPSCLSIRPGKTLPVRDFKNRYILGVVLSFDALVEGLELGARYSTGRTISAEVLVQKGLTALSMGSIFFSSKISR